MLETGVHPGQQTEVPTGQQIGLPIGQKIGLPIGLLPSGAAGEGRRNKKEPQVKRQPYFTKPNTGNCNYCLFRAWEER